MYGFVREDQTNGIWWPMQFYRLPSVFNEWISLNKQQNIELHRWFLFFFAWCWFVFAIFLSFFFLLESAFIVLGHTRSGWTLNFYKAHNRVSMLRNNRHFDDFNIYWEFLKFFGVIILFFSWKCRKITYWKPFHCYFHSFNIRIEINLLNNLRNCDKKKCYSSWFCVVNMHDNRIVSKSVTNWFYRRKIQPNK